MAASADHKESTRGVSGGISEQRDAQAWKKAPFDPHAAPEAQVVAGCARFTVLTSRMVRLEYSPGKAFENRPTQVVWNRNMPVPAFTVSHPDSATTEIKTDRLLLRYRAAGEGFAAENLSIHLTDGDTLWRWGECDTQNLGGTIRTVDGEPGGVPLPPGLMSRSGWSLIDDSRSLRFNEDGLLEPRPTVQTDCYFFGYGHDYQECLQDFCRIAGPIPMIPRWMLGNWWSRYWAYTHDELSAVVDGFLDREIPLSACIIDMDWHTTKNPYTNGWTGYTWNRELYPDPARLIRQFHEKGVRVGLNLHPRDGVHPHEEAFADFARFMGADPDEKKFIEFDLTDPRFAEGYFRFLHHPHEAIGVDIWWMDWQQGTACRLEGLDPLWLLNHLHFYDYAENQGRRPVIFSRWGGLGNHRYPIGFSGDSHVTWEALAFQPYMTAAAANVGYGWWSHDIGGHFYGTEEEELYIRWIQFGAMSPIMRLHSTRTGFQDRRPWVYDAETFRIIKKFMRFRHELIPYLYTVNHLAETRSQPPLRPMYYKHPDEEAAYSVPGQYYFGDDLIVAPVVKRMDPEVRMSRQPVWLPEGDWYDFFTGEYMRGGRMTACYRLLDQMPAFARAGALVPLDAQPMESRAGNPETLCVHVFAGADGAFDLYEDDGISSAYTLGDSCVTSISQHWRERRLVVRIQAALGNHALVPTQRSWSLQICGVRYPRTVTLVCGKENRLLDKTYDETTERLRIDVGRIGVDETFEVIIEDSEPLLARRDRTQETCIALLKRFHAGHSQKVLAARALGKAHSDADFLADAAGALKDNQLQALYEVLCDAGYERVDQFAEMDHILLWNNSGSQGMRFSFNGRWNSFSRRGIVPEFLKIGFDRRSKEDQRAVVWPRERWSFMITYGGAFTRTLSKK